MNFGLRMWEIWGGNLGWKFGVDTLGMVSWKTPLLLSSISSLTQAWFAFLSTLQQKLPGSPSRFICRTCHLLMTLPHLSSQLGWRSQECWDCLSPSPLNTARRT